MNLTISRSEIALPPGAEIILRHQTWSDYEALLEKRSEKSAVKIYFNALTQEIRLMSPSLRHGNQSDALSDMVKCILRRQGRDWHSFDPITIKKLEEKGVEPDACFYIANFQAILGKDKIDLEIDPPPDLALEVDLTSFTRPDDYESIAVPELWIYRAGVLNIYLLNEQHYHESDQSLSFPTLPLKVLVPKYLEQTWEIGTSAAMRAFEQTLETL